MKDAGGAQLWHASNLDTHNVQVPWKQLCCCMMVLACLEGIMLGASVQHCWTTLLHDKHHKGRHLCRPARGSSSAAAQHTAHV